MDKNFTTGDYRGVNTVTLYAKETRTVSSPEDDYALYADVEMTKKITNDELTKAFEETTIVIALLAEGSSEPGCVSTIISIETLNGNVIAYALSKGSVKMFGTEESCGDIVDDNEG